MSRSSLAERQARKADRERRAETARANLHANGITLPSERPRTEMDEAQSFLVAVAELAKALDAVGRTGKALSEATFEAADNAQLAGIVDKLAGKVDRLRPLLAGSAHRQAVTNDNRLSLVAHVRGAQ